MESQAGAVAASEPQPLPLRNSNGLFISAIIIALLPFFFDVWFYIGGRAAVQRAAFAGNGTTTAPMQTLMIFLLGAMGIQVLMHIVSFILASRGRSRDRARNVSPQALGRTATILCYLVFLGDAVFVYAVCHLLEFI